MRHCSWHGSGDGTVWGSASQSDRDAWGTAPEGQKHRGARGIYHFWNPSAAAAG